MWRFILAYGAPAVGHGGVQTGIGTRQEVLALKVTGRSCSILAVFPACAKGAPALVVIMEQDIRVEFVSY